MVVSVFWAIVYWSKSKKPKLKSLVPRYVSLGSGYWIFPTQFGIHHFFKSIGEWKELRQSLTLHWIHYKVTMAIPAFGLASGLIEGISENRVLLLHTGQLSIRSVLQLLLQALDLWPHKQTNHSIT